MLNFKRESISITDKKIVHCVGVKSQRDIENPSPQMHSLGINKDSESLTHLLCLSHQNLFKVESVNCICVDWKSGSRTGYTQASQNIRIVGAEVAYFIEVLQVTSCAKARAHCSLDSLPKSNKKCCRYDNSWWHFPAEIDFPLGWKTNAKKKKIQLWAASISLLRSIS